MSMREQSSGNVAAHRETYTGWFDWAERHLGVVLLGALVMAILTLPNSPPPEDTDRDTSGDEVPLFI
jgi:hypothetical protein